MLNLLKPILPIFSLSCYLSTYKRQKVYEIAKTNQCTYIKVHSEFLLKFIILEGHALIKSL